VSSVVREYLVVDTDLRVAYPDDEFRKNQWNPWFDFLYHEIRILSLSAIRYIKLLLW